MQIGSDQRGDFHGQVAVVTGGANGIGRAIAVELFERGATVAAVDVQDVDCSLFVPNGKSGSIHPFRCDTTNPVDVSAVCKDIIGRLGPPSVLVNNVGGAGKAIVGDIEELTDDILHFVLDLNVGSAVRFTREFAAGMRAKRYGRIVNISSNLRHGRAGPRGTLTARLPYVIAKEALVGLTRQLAKDLGSFQITVNAVAPGMILPGADAVITKRFQLLPQVEQQRIIGAIPVGRTGTAEEVASVVVFLSSAPASFLTGETIDVRGG